MLPLSDTRDLDAKGVRMRVVEYGGGAPLLLLHDVLMTGQAFDGVVPALAKLFRVVVPDLPGFGDSEKPSPTRFRYVVESFAECVADVIAGLSLGRAHVLGHGLGGSVALTLAVEHPEFVDRLVLVDPLVYRVPGRTSLLETPVLGGFLFKQLLGRALFRKSFRDRVFASGFPFPLALVDGFYDAFNSPAARESARATLRSLIDTQTTEARVGRVTAPTLVVWGRADWLCPSPFAPRLVREVSAARLEVMETGHAPHIEAPEAFASIVGRFLSGAKG